MNRRRIPTLVTALVPTLFALSFVPAGAQQNAPATGDLPKGQQLALQNREHRVAQILSVQRPDYWTVMHNGKTIRSWYELAINKHADTLARERAIGELGTAGTPGTFALVELLRASDKDTIESYRSSWDALAVEPGFVRIHAANTLGNMGAVATSPNLAYRMLNDNVMQVRAAASGALAKLHSRNPQVLEALKQVLRSDDYCVWPGAAAALGQVTTNDQQVVQLLNRVANVDPMISGDELGQTCIVNARTEARRALLTVSR